MPGGIALIPSLQVPIGGIAAWLKSYANTPALPAGWVECNGQTLNDSESVYNGQTIPDLNAQNRFLRGNSTSGDTGGAATVMLSVDQMPSHSHAIDIYSSTSGSFVLNFGSGYETTGAIETSSIGSGQAHENLPPYYNVVWIMRVK